MTDEQDTTTDEQSIGAMMDHHDVWDVVVSPDETVTVMPNLHAQEDWVSLLLDLSVAEARASLRAGEARELAGVLLASVDALGREGGREGGLGPWTREHVVETSCFCCDGPPLTAVLVDGRVHGRLGPVVWIALHIGQGFTGVLVPAAQAREIAFALRAAAARAEAVSAARRRARADAGEGRGEHTGDVPRR